MDLDGLISELERGYRNGTFYWWIGPTLLALNPGNWSTKASQQLYDDNVKAAMLGRGTALQTPAHIFALADRLWQKANRKSAKSPNQITAVFSGVSGSGKTESAKQLLDYLLYVGGSQTAKLLKSASLLLEAFGNAGTLANSNSSRFGRLTRIYVQHGRIAAARIDTHLLAKNRTTALPPQERNFHIFYALLQARLVPPSPGSKPAYRLLSATPAAAAAATPAAAAAFSAMFSWQEIESAFRDCGFEASEVDSIVQTLYSLLLLGEYSPLEDSGDQTLSVIAAIWRCSEDSLEEVLTGHAVKGYRRIHSREECSKVRDTLIRIVYDRLFRLIVAAINRRLSSSDVSDCGGSDSTLCQDSEKRHQNCSQRHSCCQNCSSSVATICLLDIYGFESSLSNGLEVLCINFFNENLQKVFLENFVVQEAELLLREGVTLAHSPDIFERIEFGKAQLSRSIDLIKHILRVLSDVGILPIPQDQRDHSFISNLKSQIPNLKWPQPSSFLIHHYAEPVQYQAMGFSESNGEEIYANGYELLDSCWFAAPQEKKSDSPPPTATRHRRRSFGLQFESLINDLHSKHLWTNNSSGGGAEVHFVRSIRPTPATLGSHFDRIYVTRQLQYGGIHDAVDLLKLGMPDRISISELLNRLNLNMKNCHTDPSQLITDLALAGREDVDQLLCREDAAKLCREDAAKLCRGVLRSLNVPRRNYTIGFRTLFCLDRQPILNLLDSVPLTPHEIIKNMKASGCHEIIIGLRFLAKMVGRWSRRKDAAERIRRFYRSSKTRTRFLSLTLSLLTPHSHTSSQSQSPLARPAASVAKTRTLSCPSRLAQKECLRCSPQQGDVGKVSRSSPKASAETVGSSVDLIPHEELANNLADSLELIYDQLDGGTADMRKMALAISKQHRAPPKYWKAQNSRPQKFRAQRRMGGLYAASGQQRRRKDDIHYLPEPDWEALSREWGNY